MKTTVKERLIQFIKYVGLTQRGFERSIGAGNGYLTNMSGTIGADKIHRISTEYPQLNIEWLISGEGEMLNEVFQSAEHKHSEHERSMAAEGNMTANNIGGNNMQNSECLVNALASTIAEKDKQIAKSQEQIDRLLTIIEKMQG